MSVTRRAQLDRHGETIKNSLPQPVAQALSSSEPLARLTQRLRDSNNRYRAIENDLPVALRPHVRPGPVDETGWSLLVSNGAVAAKLRQMLPRIEQTLADQGWQATTIRVRIQSG
jgi:hypothetical protein